MELLWGAQPPWGPAAAARCGGEAECLLHAVLRCAALCREQIQHIQSDHAQPVFGPQPGSPQPQAEQRALHGAELAGQPCCIVWLFMPGWSLYCAETCDVWAVVLILAFA